jgi:hypothetical protein
LIHGTENFKISENWSLKREHERRIEKEEVTGLRSVAGHIQDVCEIGGQIIDILDTLF